MPDLEWYNQALSTQLQARLFLGLNNCMEVEAFWDRIDAILALKRAVVVIHAYRSEARQCTRGAGVEGLQKRWQCDVTFSVEGGSIVLCH